MRNNGKIGVALRNLKIRPYFQKISLPLDGDKVHSMSHSVISNVTLYLHPIELSVNFLVLPSSVPLS